MARLSKIMIIACILILGFVGCENHSYYGEFYYLPCEKYDADLALTFSYQFPDTPLKFTTMFYYKRIVGSVSKEDQSISYTRSISNGNLLGGYFVQIGNGLSQNQDLPIHIKAKYLDLSIQPGINKSIDETILLQPEKQTSQKSRSILYHARWKRIWSHELND